MTAFYATLALTAAALAIAWWTGAGSPAWLHLASVPGLYVVMLGTTRRAEARYRHRITEHGQVC